MPRLPGRRAAAGRGRRIKGRRGRRRSGEPLSQGKDDRRRRRRTLLLLLLLLPQGPGAKGLGALVDRRCDGAVPAGGVDEKVRFGFVLLLPREGPSDDVEGPDGSQEAAEEDGVEGAWLGVRRGKEKRMRKRKKKRGSSLLTSTATSNDDGTRTKKKTKDALRTASAACCGSTSCVFVDIKMCFICDESKKP